MEQAKAILSEDWIWGTVLAAFLGFGLGYLAQRLQSRSHRRDAQRVAAMHIANNLRHWMRLGEGMIADMDTWQGSGGMGGKPYYRVHDFAFEASLEYVFKLDRAVVVKVLQLIHTKNDANVDIEVAIEYECADEDDAVSMTRARLARTYLDVEPIHRSLAQMIGWRLPSTARPMPASPR